MGQNILLSLQKLSHPREIKGPDDSFQADIQTKASSIVVLNAHRTVSTSFDDRANRATPFDSMLSDCADYSVSLRPSVQLTTCTPSAIGSYVAGKLMIMRLKSLSNLYFV